MANCMASPLMISRELLTMLPSDAKVFAEEMLDGNVFVRIETCDRYGSFLVVKMDRILSMNDIHERYKPLVDRFLHEAWSAPTGDRITVGFTP